MKPVLSAWRSIASGISVALLCSSAHAADTSSAAAKGKALYDQRCGLCHATGELGTFMLGRRLGQQNALLAARTETPEALVLHVVRNGINGMPTFTRVELSDAELKLIAAYLARPAQAK